MITASNLSKSYGSAVVVRDLSLHCQPGTITGFLGPNGAGKSTTLRMIVGLTRPDSGTSTINGRRFAELANPTRIIGTLLDPSAMHGGRTGRATLAIAARMAGVPLAGVQDLLGRVGLADAADRRVSDYSLGMRQRLGLAQTLIGEPEVLILDEPANGLDPEGIAWMRRLLRDFADQGGTVLLSSHLLNEVQATVDHLVVISHGAVVAAGPLTELLASSSLLLRTADRAGLSRALDLAGIAYDVDADDAFTVDVRGGSVTADMVARAALDARVVLTELRESDSGGLEQLFFSLTSATATDTQESAA
ncbi:MAG: transporter ATP-binding protein [Frankiales bacterium]|nr:transporter ATP-binding protein [Frankiales bacterium]